MQEYREEQGWAKDITNYYIYQLEGFLNIYIVSFNNIN